MRRLILFFALLLLSVWMGLWIHQGSGSGTLFLALKDKTIEMPIWFAAIMLLLGYFALWIMLQILTKIFSLKACLVHFKRHWQQKHARLNTRRGLIEFGEGNWKQAEHHLTKALPDSDTSLLNYLAAARAAQELGASERRDDYLREAQKTLPDAKIAIELTQAQLQIVNEQWEQALATLNHLHSLSPYHPYVMKLLVKVYLALKDWAELQKWMPQIQRKKVMNEKDFARLENEVYSGLLEQASKQGNSEALSEAWKKFPKSARKITLIAIAYISKLLENHADNEAEQVCRETLKHEWNNTLILLYGQCDTLNIAEQLCFAEHFLKYYPNNPYLLLTLGRICLRRQLWGKAKSYFLKSVQIQPEAETYAELAKLSEALNEKEAANEYYKQSLQLAFAAERPSKKDAFSQRDNFYCLAGKVVF